MADALVQQLDVETALLRPLSATEAVYIVGLCERVSNDLRIARPGIDDWINAWDGVTGGNRADAVAGMLAQVIKRYLANVKGVASTSDGDGPHTHSESYVSYGHNFGATGQLVITAADLASLNPISVAVPRSIKLRPALAPHHGYRRGGW